MFTRSLEVANDAFEFFVIGFTKSFNYRIQFSISKLHIRAMSLQVFGNDSPFCFEHFSICAADKDKDSNTHPFFVDGGQGTAFSRVAVLNNCIAGKVFHNFTRIKVDCLSDAFSEKGAMSVAKITVCVDSILSSALMYPPYINVALCF